MPIMLQYKISEQNIANGYIEIEELYAQWQSGQKKYENIKQ